MNPADWEREEEVDARKEARERESGRNKCPG